MPSVEQPLHVRLNEKLAPFFRRLEKTLNRKSLGYGEMLPGRQFSCPQISTWGGGVTHIPAGEDAFNLNPPFAGHIRDNLISEHDKNKFLIRRLFGYALASRLAQQSEEEAIRGVRFLIEEMLMTLRNESNIVSTVTSDVIHHGTYARFERPGYPGMYFFDNDQSAGVEIRLYSDTYPAISPGLQHVDNLPIPDGFVLDTPTYPSDQIIATAASGAPIYATDGQQSQEVVSQVTTSTGTYRLSYDTATGTLTRIDE